MKNLGILMEKDNVVEVNYDTNSETPYVVMTGSLAL